MQQHCCAATCAWPGRGSRRRQTQGLQSVRCLASASTPRAAGAGLGSFSLAPGTPDLDGRATRSQVDGRERGRDWGGGAAPGERRSGRAERISVWASGVAPSPVAVARGGRVGGPEESPIAIRQSVGVAGWGWRPSGGIGVGVAAGGGLGIRQA